MTEETNQVTVSKSNAHKEMEVKGKVEVTIASIERESSVKPKQITASQQDEVQSRNSLVHGTISPKPHSSASQPALNISGENSFMLGPPLEPEQNGTKSPNSAQDGGVMVVEFTKWFKVDDKSSKSGRITIMEGEEGTTKMASIKERNGVEGKGII